MRRIADVQTSDRNVNQLQKNVQFALDPILTNALVYGRLIENVNLVSGSNTIDHGLGRVLQGWIIVRKRSDAAIYDNQDNNSQPGVSLILVSDAAVSVNLYVF